MLDLERLRTLHAVSRLGSVGAAADALHVTSSAVSQQLTKLERETGQTLLEKNGRGIRLTEAALLLADHAGRILILVEQAGAELEAHRGIVMGRLAMAAFPTAMRGLALAAMREVRERYPDLHVSVSEEDPAEGMLRVSRGDLDLAISQDWSNRPLSVPSDLARGLICDDIADIMLPSRHPLADREFVSLRDLSEESWVTSTRDSICYDWLTHTLRSAGIEPHIEYMAGEYATQMAYVGAGLCCGILPRLGRGPVPVPDDVSVVGLRPVLTRRIYAVWRRGAARRPAISAVLTALRNAVPAPAIGHS
ncbi:LysR family transcriptional regulator [Actinocorallia aurea]